ncbi:MAG: zinc-binding dehydrogenase [Achromobacter sp.]
MSPQGVGAATATTSLAFDFLTKGGKLIIVGLFGGASSWPIALIPMKALSIVGSYVGNLAELQELMELVRAGKVPPMPVHRHALAEADSVLASLRAGKVVGRAVLTN